MDKRACIISFFMILAVSVSVFGQWAIVPIDHPVYTFLARMEVKGVISGYYDSALPLDQGQVCMLLAQIDSLIGDDLLTTVDREWLTYFRKEFWEWDWEEIEGSGTESDWFNFKDTGIFKLFHKGRFLEYTNDWFYGEGDSYTWALNPILRIDGVSDDRFDDRIWRRTSGISLRGSWKEHVGVYFRFHDTKEWGNSPYRDRNQVYDDRYGYVGPLLGDDFTYYDVTEYGMHFRWGWFRLEGGKWQNQWGPGMYGHFLLSDEGTSYDQVRLKIDICKSVRLTALTGVLKQYPSLGDTLYIAAHGEPRVVEPKKFVSAHRIDIAPHRKLQLGFSEMVIYGDRGLELGYLIPLNFYFSAEHHYGDQDNVVWAMDWKYTGIRKVRWYGELYIDDLTLAKLGENTVGNKWATMVGVRWYDPFRLPNVSLGAEFTAIRPYVFSHWFYVNTPTHWTRPLGHWAPPNSLIWTLGCDYQPVRSLSLSVRYDYQKHGANTDELNVGGDPSRPHGSVDPETVGLLDGELQRQQAFSWGVSWELMPRLHVAMEGGAVSGDVDDYNWMITGLYLNFR